jgi:hypothetical protein
MVASKEIRLRDNKVGNSGHEKHVAAYDCHVIIDVFKGLNRNLSRSLKDLGLLREQDKLSSGA